AGVAVSIMAGAAGVVMLMAQAPQGSFTAAQAAAGRAAYATAYANCQEPDLGGRNDAAQLAGGLFLGSWGARTTAHLVGFLRGAMPPGNAGSLGGETYV